MESAPILSSFSPPVVLGDVELALSIASLGGSSVGGHRAIVMIDVSRRLGWQWSLAAVMRYVDHHPSRYWSPAMDGDPSVYS